MKILKCEDCGHTANLSDDIRHDNVRCAPCNGKMNLMGQTDSGAKLACCDGLDIKKYVRCGTCDSGLSIADVDYMPLSRVPGNKLERCLFDCPACGNKSGSFIFFKD